MRLHTFQLRHLSQSLEQSHQDSRPEKAFIESGQVHWFRACVCVFYCGFKGSVGWMWAQGFGSCNMGHQELFMLSPQTMGIR